MAVDTRDKRASCLGIAGPYRVVFPNPDGATTEEGDRQQVAYAYSGIEAGEAITVTVGVKVHSRARQFRRISRGHPEAAQVTRSNAQGPSGRTPSRSPFGTK